MDNSCYIIQHRDITHKKDRTLNLLTVIKYIRSYSNIPIMIIEQSQKEDLFLTNKLSNVCNLDYKHLYNPGLFNRSWGFNYAAKVTNVDKLVFADNDMLLTVLYFNEGIKALDEFDVVRPYNGWSLDLSQTYTIEFIKSNCTNLIFDNSLRHRNINNYSGGLIMFNRESFLNKVKGFDERFEGWGGEDDEMHKHLNKLIDDNIITFKSLGSNLIHLYHDRNVYDGNTQPNYERNCSYINDGKRNLGIEEIGNPNKYKLNYD